MSFQTLPLVVWQHHIMTHVPLADVLRFRLCSRACERISRKRLSRALSALRRPLFTLLSFAEHFCDGRLGDRRDCGAAMAFFACAALEAARLLNDKAPAAAASGLWTQERRTVVPDEELMELTEGRAFEWGDKRQSMLCKWYVVQLRGMINSVVGTYYEGQVYRTPAFYFAYATYRVCECLAERRHYERALAILVPMLPEAEHMESGLRSAIVRLTGMCLLEQGWRTQEDGARRRAFFRHSIAQYRKVPGALSLYNIACAHCCLHEVEEAKRALEEAFVLSHMGLPSRLHALQDEQLKPLLPWLLERYPDVSPPQPPASADRPLGVAAFSTTSLDPPPSTGIRILGYD